MKAISVSETFKQHINHKILAKYLLEYCSLISLTTFIKLLVLKLKQKLSITNCMCKLIFKLFFVVDEFDCNVVSSSYVAYAYEQ